MKIILIEKKGQKKFELQCLKNGSTIITINELKINVNLLKLTSIFFVFSRIYLLATYWFTH